MKSARDSPGRTSPNLLQIVRSGLLDEHLVPTFREGAEDQPCIRQVADVDAAVAAVVAGTGGAVVVGTEPCRVVEPDVGREDREVRHVRLIAVGVPVLDLDPDPECTGWRVLVHPLADLFVVRVPAGPRLDGAEETSLSEEVDACDVADGRGTAAAHLVDDRDRPALLPARAEARDDLGVRPGVRSDVSLGLGSRDAVGDEAPEPLVLGDGSLGADTVAAVRSEATTGDASDA